MKRKSISHQQIKEEQHASQNKNNNNHHVSFSLRSKVIESIWTEALIPMSLCKQPQNLLSIKSNHYYMKSDS